METLIKSNDLYVRLSGTLKQQGLPEEILAKDIKTEETTKELIEMIKARVDALEKEAQEQQKPFWNRLRAFSSFLKSIRNTHKQNICKEQKQSHDLKTILSRKSFRLFSCQKLPIENLSMTADLFLFFITNMQVSIGANLRLYPKQTHSFILDTAKEEPKWTEKEIKDYGKTLHSYSTIYEQISYKNENVRIDIGETENLYLIDTACRLAGKIKANTNKITIEWTKGNENIKKETLTTLSENTVLFENKEQITLIEYAAHLCIYLFFYIKKPPQRLDVLVRNSEVPGTSWEEKRPKEIHGEFTLENSLEINLAGYGALSLPFLYHNSEIYADRLTVKVISSRANNLLRHMKKHVHESFPIDGLDSLELLGAGCNLLSWFYAGDRSELGLLKLVAEEKDAIDGIMRAAAEESIWLGTIHCVRLKDYALLLMQKIRFSQTIAISDFEITITDNEFLEQFSNLMDGKISLLLMHSDSLNIYCEGWRVVLDSEAGVGYENEEEAGYGYEADDEMEELKRENEEDVYVIDTGEPGRNLYAMEILDKHIERRIKGT